MCRIFRTTVALLVTAATAYPQVSMLIANNGKLAAAETINATPAAPKTDQAAAVMAVGQVQPVDPIVVSPIRKVESEPYIAPVASTPANQPVEKPYVEPELPEPKPTAPDAAGIVLLNPQRKTGDGKSANPEVIAPHNPWGVRVVTKETLLSFTVELQSIIIGPNPTASINGVPVHQGERKIGPFVLYGIRKHDVIMEYDGATFILPISRKVTVRIPKQ